MVQGFTPLSGHWVRWIQTKLSPLDEQVHSYKKKKSIKLGVVATPLNRSALGGGSL